MSDKQPLIRCDKCARYGLLSKGLQQGARWICARCVKAQVQP